MKEIIKREEQFLNQALHWTVWLGVLIALLLFLVHSAGAAIGFLGGVGLSLGITFFYRGLVARFAYPGVRKVVLPRVLALVALGKYPLLLLVTYGVVRGGLPVTIGFLGGVSLFLGVLVSMVVGAGFKRADR